MLSFALALLLAARTTAAPARGAAGHSYPGTARVQPSAAPGPGYPLKPLAEPAMRLYGIVSPSSGWGDDPQRSNTTWSADDVNVASHLEMVYGGRQDEPTAKALAGKTQRVKYKNFGGTAPLEVSTTETEHHADVAYYRAGVLGEALTAQQNTLHLHMEPHVPHGGPSLPVGKRSCPFGLRASTAKGNTSTVDMENGGAVNTYITWLRVEEEYMKIVGVSLARADPEAEPGAIVTVERGLWGSAPTLHTANVSVLAPIYHSRGGWPEGGSGRIRYALDQSRSWVAEYNAEAYTTPDLLDGLWLDCMGVLGFQSHDSCGGNVRGLMFNASGDRRYGKAGYVDGQRAMVARIRAQTAARGATVLYANNVDDWDNAPELLQPHVLLDGGAKEGFIGSGSGGCGFVGSWHIEDEDKWAQAVSGVMNVSQGDFPVMPMTGSAGCESPQLASMETAARAVVEDFAYASFLLAAGTRTQMLGIVPYRLRDREEMTSKNPRIEMYLHPRYYFPLGSATQTSPTLEGYRISACTYARRFEFALALVNPATNCSDARLPLNGTWYDPQGDPSVPITSVAVPAQHGQILLSGPLAAATAPPADLKSDDAVAARHAPVLRSGPARVGAEQHRAAWASAAAAAVQPWAVEPFRRRLVYFDSDSPYKIH
jgi:hypothetical protein